MAASVAPRGLKSGDHNSVHTPPWACIGGGGGCTGGGRDGVGETEPGDIQQSPPHVLILRPLVFQHKGGKKSPTLHIDISKSSPSAPPQETLPYGEECSISAEAAPLI